MDCHHFTAGTCRSCTLLEIGYVDQVAAKERAVRDLLPDGIDWLPSVVGSESGFRNKAKMVVSGTAEAPVLGILDRAAVGVDLRDCGLYPAELSDAFDPLSRFITLARLTPYDVAGRRGELKHLLLTLAPSGELMVRFVLRSTEAVLRIRKHLPTLLGWLPQASVVAVNLLPEHKAVLEGEQETVLHGESLTMRVNDLDLHLRPQSFFQTNTEIAAALYRQVRAWIAEKSPREVWDLYCGVGGFALHAAAPGRRIVGVEVSREAVASAQRSARGLPGEFEFLTADATRWAVDRTDAPDLVVVNPPRRGIGVDLATWLERSSTPSVVYSSCNASSLARDLAAMPSLRPVQARLLDMFPQTDHYEVAVLLERKR